VDQDRFDAQETRDFACMLAACTAEAGESVIANMNSVSIYFDNRNRRNAYMCLPVAYPLASVSARMGLHIVSFATLMNLYNTL